jgi:hypothetical protein
MKAKSILPEPRLEKPKNWAILPLLSYDSVARFKCFPICCLLARNLELGMGRVAIQMQ